MRFRIERKKCKRMNLFQSAEYAESLSNCLKRRVGASLSINNEVVAIGFNHADMSCKCSLSSENPQVQHAEIACLEHYEFLGEEYSEMAVTYICCIDCSKHILKKGVKRIYYRDHRDEKSQGINFLKSNGVEVLNEWSV